MGRVLFIACTNVGIGMIEEIKTNPEIQKTEIVGIVNLNPVKGISKANYQTYIEISQKYDIPLHFCNNINDEETIAWMEEKKPDLIIQTGWSQKFSPRVLSLARYACIGEHPAPLPKGRGAACINWAILTGETSWGDTFFQMVEEYDKGVIYDQEPIVIREYDNVKTVYDKIECSSRTVIARNIDKWSNGIFEPKTQDDSLATHYPRRRPSDGVFRFEDFETARLHDFIRAQAFPYPGAFFFYGDKKITVQSARIVHGEVLSQAPGSLLGFDDETGGARFVCKDGGVIEILRVKPEGKAEMWAIDCPLFDH